MKIKYFVYSLFLPMIFVWLTYIGFSLYNVLWLGGTGWVTIFWDLIILIINISLLQIIWKDYSFYYKRAENACGWGFILSLAFSIIICIYVSNNGGLQNLTGLRLYSFSVIILTPIAWLVLGVFKVYEVGNDKVN